MADGSDLKREKLYLLDAMALAYRSHFALIARPLITTTGIDTSAVFGFTQSLIKLLDDESPDHIAVVFDPVDGKSFRDELYHEYKANRPKMPEPLREAIPHIKELVRSFQIPVVEVAGMEADDVIGTLAKRAEREGVDVVIVSPDKDFRQLLSPHVTIMRPAYRGVEFEVVTESAFVEKYGVEPVKFIDILALLGDASDNVPGVPGIGAKSAPKLVQEYGSVENLLDHASEITGKRIREGLENGRESALLSKKLVTIVTDLDLKIDWHDLRTKGPDLERLIALFDLMEFRTLRKRALDRWGSGGPTPPSTTGAQPEKSDQVTGQGAFNFGEEEKRIVEVPRAAYKTLSTLQALTERLGAMKDQSRIGLATDVRGSDAMRATVKGLVLLDEDQTAWYVPASVAIDDAGGRAALNALLGDTGRTVVGYDLKNQRITLSRHGIYLTATLEDAMVAHYLLSPDSPHDLERVARSELGQAYDRVRPDSDDASHAYDSVRNVILANEIITVVNKRLEDDEDDRRPSILRDIEYPLIPVLADMESAGVRVNVEALADISQQLGKQGTVLKAAIFELAGEEFNIASPKQLGEVLFDRMGLKPMRKTSTGKRSTNERVLMQLASEHELPGKILDWRRVTKLKSTYVDTLADYIHPDTGRIHGSFNQAVAATGRLSSANPNLQNIPVRSGTGREIRRAFIPADGMRFLVADYVQIELRILASMSEDTALMAAFENGDDVHRATAARMFGIPAEDVDRDQRRRAKEVNFGIPYGISAYELSQRLRITRDEATDLIEQYHRSYPEVTRLKNLLIHQARTHGYVETMLGRRRYTPQIESLRFNERSSAERIAVNMPIQGTQADMIKKAMVAIHYELGERAMKSRLILQVHDELVFEVVETERDELRAIVEEEMVNALPLKVPIEVDLGEGDNWLEAH